MISWIIDQIPLWVYVAIAVPLVGAAFYFFSPILIPLWNFTPRWIKVVGGVVIAICSAFVAGRNKGAKDAKEIQKQNDAAAVETRKEVDMDVRRVAPVDRDKRLDGWMRDDK